MKDKSLYDSSFNFWPSWSDLLLSILLMLILYIFIQFLINAIDTFIIVQQKQAKIEEEIKKEFADEYQKVVKVNTDGNLQKITFSDKILFDLGKADLKEEGEDALLRIGSILEENQFYRKIQIEGHTDDIPISSKYTFASNWELSSARATSVVRFLQDEVGIDPQFLSATGYSEYQPIVSNLDNESRSLNRRIELVLVYTTQEGQSWADYTAK